MNDAAIARFDGMAVIDGSIPTRTTSSTLVHGKSALVTLDELRTIPTPQGTATFKPVPHIELVEGIKYYLEQNDVSVVRQAIAVQRGGALMFGTMDLAGSLNGPLDGFRAALGFRQGNNKLMSIQLVAGARVFVCDNLALSGDTVALKRKHTSGLDVLAELRTAVIRVLEQFGVMARKFEALKNMALGPNDARARIYDAIEKRIIAATYFHAVHDAYFNPTADENGKIPYDVQFKDTLWALQNAFTFVLRSAPMAVQQNAAIRLAPQFALSDDNTEENGITEDIIDV
jgi:hypothetical protein